MNFFSQEYGGELTAIITNALIFEAAEIRAGAALTNRFFTENAAWDTGAEISIIPPRVVNTLHLKPFARTSIMDIGGDEEVGVYKVHLGLPNGYLYKDRYVYCSDIDDYDILIGMDIISKSDFFLTRINDRNYFYFRLPAEGGKDLLNAL